MQPQSDFHGVTGISGDLGNAIRIVDNRIRVVMQDESGSRNKENRRQGNKDIDECRHYEVPS
jgi:hypothetical protein